MYLSILSRKQKELLKKLGFLKKYEFYLAGGTNLALQIGHRISLDFDFYTKKRFNKSHRVTLYFLPLTCAHCRLTEPPHR